MTRFYLKCPRCGGRIVVAVVDRTFTIDEQPCGCLLDTMAVSQLRRQVRLCLPVDAWVARTLHALDQEFRAKGIKL